VPVGKLEIPRIIECAVHNLRISRKFLFAVNLLIFPQKSRGIPARKPLHWRHFFRETSTLFTEQELDKYQ
jgi:hypothetical protein